MRYTELLIERVVNLFTPAEKEKYGQEVWDLLQSSYASVGGFQSAASVEELIAKTGLWKLVTRDGKLSSVALYKDSLGRKSIAFGSNGTTQGKRDFIKTNQDDVKFQRAWAEVSGAPEVLTKRAGGQPVPNTLAHVLTGKEILDLNPDGYHYTRLISGKPYEKIIYGFVALDQATVEKLKAHGVDVASLPGNVQLPK